jgi:hypothetical protein
LPIAALSIAGPRQVRSLKQKCAGGPAHWLVLVPGIRDT